MTLQVPNSQLGWFEQMVRTMGWPFSKEETPKANSIEQRVFEAEQKLRNEVEAERQFRSLRGCWADDPEDADSMVMAIREAREQNVVREITLDD